MTTRERRSDRARQRAGLIVARVGAEVRAARRAAGLSIREASQSVGLDASVFRRMERARSPNVSVVSLVLACEAVGLEFAAQVHVAGEPVRDAGSARLLERLRQVLPRTAPWATEVPLPIAGDRRACDAQTTVGREVVLFEAETRLDDLQAVSRRALLKKRDTHGAALVLVVADTRHNRAVLHEHRALLRGSFPLDTRAVLAALRRGQLPDGDGIVVL